MCWYSDTLEDSKDQSSIGQFHKAGYRLLRGISEVTYYIILILTY